MSLDETELLEVEELSDPKLRFEEFLKTFQDRVTGRFKYRERIRRMIITGMKSLVIDFEDLYMYDSELARNLINQPDTMLTALSDAIRSLAEIEDPEYVKTVDKFYPRIKGLPNIVRIRDIRSDHIGKLIMIEGILVRATPIREKVVKAIFRHMHPECGQEFMWPPKGEMGEVIEYPLFCPLCGKSGGSFKLVPEKSKFIDWQKIVIQERPEEIPSGQIPRSIEAVVTADLVDKARPGDRVSLTGILRIKQSGKKKASIGIFDIYLDVNYIEASQRLLEEVEITKEDEEKIKELAKDPWIHKRIIASIAPTIYGHWDIKEAIALLLFGGVPKQAEDGTRIRGDIHVLLIGDPGTAKSQLLQYAARIAPRGIYTSGKGATAAGLTAAVVRDKSTGEWYLEAGALVLADGGMAAIDEIDKMREEDRSAIHEAMEQQTVSIAKAGIVARLNARSSILAAGNPKFGRYMKERSVAENINLPATILSRFDLIFVLKDIPDSKKDYLMAEHILRVHKEIELVKPDIPAHLLRKYISYARRYVRPKLTDEAIKLLQEFFVEMRKVSEARESSGARESPVAITPRQLEALVRLAEAHAKMALREYVTVEDAEEAIRLMKAFLESVGIDVESGKIDIDIIMTGKARSQQEKLSIIVDIIENESMESDYGCVYMKKIAERAREYNLTEEFVLRALRILRREGTIYEPKPHCYAVVK